MIYQDLSVALCAVYKIYLHIFQILLLINICILQNILLNILVIHIIIVSFSYNQLKSNEFGKIWTVWKILLNNFLFTLQ